MAYFREFLEATGKRKSAQRERIMAKRGLRRLIRSTRRVVGAASPVLAASMKAGRMIRKKGAKGAARAFLQKAARPSIPVRIATSAARRLTRKRR